MNAEDELAGIGIDLSVQPPMVEAALRFMIEKLSTPISADDLTEAVGCGKRDLPKLFAPTIGRLPFVVLQQLRLQRARQLMSRVWRQIGVKTIAQAVGIPHASRFATQYRKVYGESPSDVLARRPRQPLH